MYGVLYMFFFLFSFLLFVFDIRVLITSLVSSNFSYKYHCGRISSNSIFICDIYE